MYLIHQFFHVLSIITFEIFVPSTIVCIHCITFVGLTWLGNKNTKALRCRNMCISPPPPPLCKSPALFLFEEREWTGIPQRESSKLHFPSIYCTLVYHHRQHGRVFYSCQSPGGYNNPPRYNPHSMPHDINPNDI